MYIYYVHHSNYLIHMGKFDAKKFRFSETFTNVNGKTSGSGFLGIILGIIAGASFISAMVGWFMQLPGVIDVMGKILELALASAVLLGVRKISGNFVKPDLSDNGNNNIDINSEQIVDMSKKG